MADSTALFISRVSKVNESTVFLFMIWLSV
ncbi:Uncharacterised protein [Vibrio cholerae]|nr:Uncharacterised protein [Vibrio cholerae]